NLNSVQELACDIQMLWGAANKLREIGGIPGRLGSQIQSLFEWESKELTKEGSSVLSTVSRHLSFLDSELIAKSLARSSFDPVQLRKPGTVLFFQVSPEH